MDNIETYKVLCSDQEESMVYTISLVDDPANMTDFIYMNKEKSNIKLNKEKRLVTGVVLIPEQLIYRFNEKMNKEYYLKFGEEEIRSLSQNFFKNGFQRNSNINHDEKRVIQNITYVEQWIVEDPNNDKSNALGFKNLPKGTWMATAFIEDESTWEMVKNGEVKGFSIESFIETEKIEMNLTINKNKKEKMGLLKSLIKMFSENGNINLASGTSDIGDISADSFELDNIVYQDVEGEMVPVIDSTFILEGKVYKTDAEGKIIDIVDEAGDMADESEDKAEDKVDDKAEDKAEDKVDESEDKAEDKADEAEDKADETIDYVAVIENITKELESVLLKNKELSAKVEELSKEPAATKLKSNVVSRANETRTQALNRISGSN